MKTKLERWLLVKLILVVVVLAFMTYVNVEQDRTIQAQRTEMVKQIHALIASEEQQVQLVNQMDKEEKQFEEALKTCK